MNGWMNEWKSKGRTDWAGLQVDNGQTNYQTSRRTLRINERMDSQTIIAFSSVSPSLILESQSLTIDVKNDFYVFIIFLYKKRVF